MEVSVRSVECSDIVEHHNHCFWCSKLDIYILSNGNKCENKQDEHFVCNYNYWPSYILLIIVLKHVSP